MFSGKHFMPAITTPFNAYGLRMSANSPCVGGTTAVVVSYRFAKYLSTVHVSPPLETVAMSMVSAKGTTLCVVCTVTFSTPFAKAHAREGASRVSGERMSRFECH